ncbi:protein DETOXIFICATION 40-like isoform X2 [Nymphaea colorata]|uniref:protein DETOXIFICATION 40-like isoform X2 n=1 Tax=Nymphaea colorata TaxID=210225 RepID=UPI00214EB235|nr:protein DETOXIFICATION 40-like isoform X2 [Nymphaea colorata]XP_049931949.1 protein DETOXIFICATION 40-like isoform X2 [Nymphaea colorata]
MNSGVGQIDMEEPLLVQQTIDGKIPVPAAPTWSAQLESILNDDGVPWLHRMRAATWVELRLLCNLAGPAVLVYMLNYVMSMATRIFSGHLGNLELAAASLGNTGIQVFALGRSDGVAVGCGRQAFVAYVIVGCYYIVGIPLALCSASNSTKALREYGLQCWEGL